MKENGQGIVEVIGCLGVMIGLCVAAILLLKAIGIDLGIQFPPGW